VGSHPQLISIFSAGLRRWKTRITSAYGASSSSWKPGSFEATASCATLDLLPCLPQSYICVVGMILKTDGIGRGSGSRPNGVVIDHDACALDNDSNLCYVQVPQLILTKHLRIRASGVSVSWAGV